MRVCLWTCPRDISVGFLFLLAHLNQEAGGAGVLGEKDLSRGTAERCRDQVHWPSAAPN